ncbi:MAG: hypothetical protein NTW87_23600 [Planctomycetota bacterium]|nr:hypothetical protein [Planctomycetota bacterium]
MAMNSFLDTAKDCVADGDPKKGREQMMAFMGPQAVDHAVRSAINLCWMMLPDEKKNIDNVEAEIQRLVERALKDLRADCQAFGIPAAGGPRG